MIDGRWFEMLQSWQTAGRQRSLTINIGDPADPTFVRVWAFDFTLMQGQSVVWPDLPNIEQIVEARERAKLEELRAKYA